MYGPKTKGGRGLALLLSVVLWCGVLAEAAAQPCPPNMCCAANPTPGTPPCGVAVGNPLNAISGNKFQREVDMPALPGVLGLELVRYYNSESALSGYRGLLGSGWRLSYEWDLVVHPGGDSITVHQGDGTQTRFFKSLAQTEPGVVVYGSNQPGQAHLRVTRTASGLEYTAIFEGRHYVFDAQGKLARIAVPTGEYVTLQRDVAGFLLRVTDPQGRHLSLGHLPSKQARAGDRFRGVQHIDSPVGRFTYSHGSEPPPGGNGPSSGRVANLVKVSVPTHYDPKTPAHPLGGSADRGVSTSSVTRVYHYEDPRHPTLLTGLSVQGQGGDGQLMNRREATWGYDARGRANLSVKGRYEPAQPGVDQVALSHNPRSSDGSGVTLLTNGQGQVTRYSYVQINGTPRLTEVRGAGCPSCGPVNVRYRYDSRGRQTHKVQLNDEGLPVAEEVTDYDGADRPVRISTLLWQDGKAGAPTTMVRYEYGADPQDRLPVRIARPSVVDGREYSVRIDYNRWKQPIRVFEEGFSPVDKRSAISRSTEYGYVQINGRSVLARIDGPLANGPKGSPEDSDVTLIDWDARGHRVLKVRYPAGLTAGFEHDEAGRLVRRLGVDGVLEQLRYDTQGRIVALERGGSALTLLYDAAGRVTGFRDAIGQQLQLQHDEAGRATELRDAHGNRIVWDYEADSLRRVRLLNPDGTVSQSRAPETASSANRTAAASWWPTPAVPDGVELALARVPMLADTVSGPPTALDALGRRTAYAYDDFGRLVQQHSPVTGSTLYRYDAAGQLVERVAADGGRLRITRDPAGRAVRVASEGEDAQIEWGPAGKPVRVRYMEGEERFEYDSQARLRLHAQQVDGKEWAVSYAYDAAGRLVHKSLPDGQRLVYRYNGSVHAKPGLLAGIEVDGVLDATVISGLNASQERFDDRGFTHGNGLVHRRKLDAEGRLISIGSAGSGLAQLHWTSMGAVRAQYHPSPAAGQATSAEATLPFWQRASFQLAQLGADVPRNIVQSTGLPSAQPQERLDTRGRLVDDGRRRYVWDGLDRLVEVWAQDGPGQSGKLLARYRYNLFGERIAKVVHGAQGRRVEYFFYEGGQLSAQADSAGQVTAQYVYLEGRPVAMLKGRAILALHTDHRMAVTAVSDKSRNMLWQAGIGEHGEARVAEGSSLDMPLRASNQYFDAETGLHYNIRRYLNPQQGRYISADPMGLAAGPDLHLFALGQPHRYIDPLGLQPQDWSKASYEEKFKEIITRAVPMLPGEIGSALQQLVQPENLAVMGAIFAVWAGSQFTPVGWIADLALLGMGIWYAGSGVIDLIKTFVTLNNDIKAAKCDPDLTAAAKRLANGFVTGTGELVGGLAGTWGLAKSGGLTRIAKGIESLVAFGKRQIKKPGTVPAAPIVRPDTSAAVYGPDAKYKKPNGDWNWPPNDGFAGPRVKGALPKDTLLDRFGAEGGSFLSPKGTPFEMRALAPSSLKEPYYVYRAKKPLPVESGRIAAAFDQPGGGTQYLLDWAKIAVDNGTTVNAIRSYPGGGIRWLVEVGGYLERLTPSGGIPP
jgi:RHS repeat-associated protein